MKQIPIYVYLVVMAGVTYLIRAIPLVFVRKKITNRFVLSLLHYIPYSVLSAMTFPAVFYVTGNIYTASFGVAAGLFLSYKGKTLPIIAATTCLVSLLSSIILNLISS